MSSTRENLKSRVVRAGAWATAYSVAGIVLRLGSSLILTRLLVPEVFGLVSLSSALLTIVNLFSDIGLGPCVIYHKHGEERAFLDTVRTMTAIRGTLIATVATLVALALKVGVSFGLFAAQSTYNHPDLPAVLMMTALTSVILGFKSPKMFVCERRLDLKTLLSVELVASVVGIAATVCLTWLWRSVWAIVVGGYATALVSVFLSHYWVPGDLGRFGWDKGYAREIIRYGRWVLMSSMAHVLGVNADRLLLGIWLAPTMLGFYTLALNIVGALSSIAVRPFEAVGMSAFSELARERRDALRKAYFRLRLPFDLTSTAAAGFLFATGQLLIDVLYDDRYRTAGRTLQILSFSLMFPRFNVISTVHAALGHPETGSWASVVRLASVVLFVPIAHGLWGYEGTIWAVALFQVPNVLFLLWRNRRFDLNDLLYEVKMLAAWPAGFVLGWSAVQLVPSILALVGR
jgi:O-antigen/teichoic acid export membrane protein